MAGDGTIVTTVDQALMRGFEPPYPEFVAELPRSRVEHGGFPLIEPTRVLLTVVPSPGMGADGMSICFLSLP
jgi:hypothetical protein